MSEAKVRLWDDREKRMFYSDDKTEHGASFLMNLDGDPIWSKPTGKLNNYDCVWGRIGHELTVLRFTGLPDKISKDVYEGDVLREYLMNESLYLSTWKVISRPECFWMLPVIPSDHCDDDHGGYLLDEDVTNRFQVIGNIYENKELLEVKT